MKGQQPEANEIESLTVPYSIIPLKVPEVDAERCLIRIEGVASHG